MTSAPGTSIRVRIHRVDDAQIGWQIVAPGRVRRQAHGVGTHAMVGVSKGDDVVVAGVDSGHHHGHVIGLGAGIDKVAYFEIARHGGRQPTSVFVDLRVEIDGGGVPKTIDLRVKSGVNFRVTVTHADGDDAPEKVQIAFTIRVPKPLHGTAMYVQRAGVVVGHAGTQVFAADGSYLGVVET